VCDLRLQYASPFVGDATDRGVGSLALADVSIRQPQLAVLAADDGLFTAIGDQGDMADAGIFRQARRLPDGDPFVADLLFGVDATL
jgi:hypothetical protein